jgi:Domain of unknown function (DUF4397)
MDHPTVKIPRLLPMLLCAVALAACEKDAVQVLPTDAPQSSRVKFFNYGVGAPGVNFYADETKMTAVVSATGSEATTGVAYGAVGNGGAYSSIAPGTYSMTGRIAATTDKNLPIATVPGTIGDGKFYSLYLTGFYNAAAKTVDAFVLEDVYPVEIDFSIAQARFVHTVSNANPLTLYAVNTTTGDTLLVADAVAYKSASAFTQLPPGIYNLVARYPGDSLNTIVSTSVTLAGGKVYTIGARGDITVTSTTAATRPLLDNAANR